MSELEIIPELMWKSTLNVLDLTWCVSPDQVRIESKKAISSSNSLPLNLIRIKRSTFDQIFKDSICVTDPVNREKVKNGDFSQFTIHGINIDVIE